MDAKLIKAIGETLSSHPDLQRTGFEKGMSPWELSANDWEELKITESILKGYLCLTRINHPPKPVGSYYLKHIIEDISKQNTSIKYVSNGILILSMLSLGFLMVKKDGRNSIFAMDQNCLIHLEIERKLERGIHNANLSF